MTKIKVKQNETPDLKMPKFNVDGELDTKLNDFEITSLMNKSNVTLYLGRAGSGKTSLMTSFLKTKSLFYRCYSTIILFMPPNSRQSMKDGFFDKFLHPKQIYDELTLENLNNAFSVAEENSQDDKTTLIIFDDIQRYIKGLCEKKVLHMINNRRHNRLSLWFCCQNYNSMPRQVRSGITDMFIFKINKTEMENIFLEQIEQHKDRFLEILKFVFRESHDFMYLNTNSQRIFSNWNELILDEE